MIERVVSGGQTGVDRAALDWAIERGVPHGGWCPRGRRAEDGPLPPRYALVETESDGYIARTERNVVDSDATLIVARTTPLSGGTGLTVEFAEKHSRPCHVAVETDDLDGAAAALRAFVARHEVRTLNVAGPREAKAPGIGAFVAALLDGALLDGALA